MAKKKPMTSRKKLAPRNMISDTASGKNFIAEEMRRLREEMKASDNTRLDERNNDASIYLDAGDYSKSLTDFKEDAIIFSVNNPSNKYLEYLRQQKKRYSNASVFYTKWGGAEGGETFASEYAEIIQFINQEIGTRLVSQEEMKPHENSPSSDEPGSNESNVVPNSFYDLFYNQNDIDLCFGLLKNANPAIISHDNVFLLKERKKQVINAWYNAISARGYLRLHPEPKKAAFLLNEAIGHLQTTERTFRRSDAKYYQQYYDDFLSELQPRVKIEIVTPAVKR